MSTYNANPNQLGRAATYQAVIIALVAGAILVIALMSLVWRRRRRAQFLEHVNRARTARDESRWGWVEMADGRLVQIRQRDRTKAKGEVGRQPQVWDVGLGNREADEYLPVEGLERGGRDRRLMEKDEVDEVSVDGSWGEEWKVSKRFRSCDDVR
jgi:hypothetical protein